MDYTSVAEATSAHRAGLHEVARPVGCPLCLADDAPRVEGLRAVLELLESIEWRASEYPEGDDACPSCLATKSDGHHSRCRLAALLNHSTPTPEECEHPGLSEEPVGLQHALDAERWSHGIVSIDPDPEHATRVRVCRVCDAVVPVVTAP